MTHSFRGTSCPPLSNHSLVGRNFLSALIWWLTHGAAFPVSPCLMTHSCSGTSCLFLVWWLTHRAALPVCPCLMTHLWSDTSFLPLFDGSLMEWHLLSAPFWWLSHRAALPVWWLTCELVLPFCLCLMTPSWSGTCCLSLFNESLFERHFLSASVWRLTSVAALSVCPCLMTHAWSGTSCLPLSDDSLVEQQFLSASVW